MGNLTSGSFVVALSGIVIVFLMLIVLCLMIPAISKIARSLQNKPSTDEQVIKVAPTALPVVPSDAGGVALTDVDEKTAACIMAIVSHESGIPLSELIFKAIKAI